MNQKLALPVNRGMFVGTGKQTASQQGKNHAGEPPEDTHYTKGMWDVAYALMQQFPKLAVIAVFLILAYFGAKEILDQRDKAQAELSEARKQIDEIRRDADKIRQDAFQLIKDAHQEKIAAIEALKQSEIESERAVQEKLIETSSRIQTLVAGQIKSMEALETLRQATATDLNQQLETLRNRRNNTEKELQIVREEVKLSELSFSIKQLRNSVSTNDYNLVDNIKLVASSIDNNDQNSVRYILEKIDEFPDPRTKMSLLVSLFLHSKDEKYLTTFRSLFAENSDKLDPVWIETIFSAYDLINEAAWHDLYDLVLNTIADRNADPKVRYALTSFFGTRPNRWRYPLFFDQDVDIDDRCWQALELLVSMTLKRTETVDNFYMTTALSRILSLEPSALHAVATHIENSSQFTNEEKRQARFFLEQNAERTPALKRLVDQDVLLFWESDAYLDRPDDYQALNTKELYSPANN